MMQTPNNKGVTFIINSVAGDGFKKNIPIFDQLGLIANITWANQPMNELNINKIQQGMFITEYINFHSN
ncbi:hypothetical protein [Bartonella sp. HY406]|uniref:hypothetical protein n=1 Tax=Bartonella sp. HY406 TaxID=2979331 RepID=UPI0021CA8D26|nr:hypothetical protein [Bartonella sp. HY406]UXN02297.1 hypothetical protein N6B01_07250 [Bartonella sp. HY406]